MAVSPRTIANIDITTAYGAAADSSAWVTKQSPNTKAYIEIDLDDQGRAIRKYLQANGRVDLIAYADAGQGPPIRLAFDTQTPANGNQGGHFAFGCRDSNLQMNTISAVYGYVIDITGNSSSSQLQFGVMRNVDATLTAPNAAQPNIFAIMDGKTNVFSLPAGMSFQMSGGILSSAASGPVATFTNTANSRNAVVGILDNFNGGLNVTGGGAAKLQAGGVDGVSTNGTVTTLGIATKLQIESRSSKSASYPVVAADGGTQFDNNGASGSIDFTLPSAPSSGYRVGFMVYAAQQLRVVAPASTTINLGGAVSAAAGNIASSQVGAYVEVEYVGGNRYVAKMVTGTGGTTGAGGWTVT